MKKGDIFYLKKDCLIKKVQFIEKEVELLEESYRNGICDFKEDSAVIFIAKKRFTKKTDKFDTGKVSIPLTFYMINGSVFSISKQLLRKATDG